MTRTLKSKVKSIERDSSTSVGSKNSVKDTVISPVASQDKKGSSNNTPSNSNSRSFRNSYGSGAALHQLNEGMSSQITLDLEEPNMEKPQMEESKNASEEFPSIKVPEDVHSTSSGTDNKPKRSKSDTTGLFSSIMNAAHSAANIISSSVDDETQTKEYSFSHKLDNLLRPSKKDKNSSESVNAPSEKSEILGQSLDLEPSKSVPSLTPASVQFESVRESPLKTLGNGNLDLKNFDEKPVMKRSTSRKSRSRLSPSHSVDNIDKYLSPDSSNRHMPAQNQLTVSGDSESKRVHRKLLLGRVRSTSNVSKRDIDGDYSYDSGTDSDEGSDADNLDSVIDNKSLHYASKKKNKEYHHTFKGIPSSDRLIEDFGCAFSKDILVHGKLYLTEHYLCFNSNILGWVTNLVIPLQEIIQIEKKSTAMLFPNGLVIRTLHQKYVFASFLSRDTTFSLITSLWHRVLMENSDMNPNRLIKISSSLDKNKRDSKSMILKSSTDVDIDSSDLSDEGEDFSEDETGDLTRSSSRDLFTDEESKSHLSVGKSVSNEISLASNYSSKNKSTPDMKYQGDTFKGLPLVGPLEHAAVNINYNKQSNEIFIVEETFKAPLGVIFLLLFGENTSYYIKILKEQKNFSISESEISGLSMSKKERKYNYIKPLGGAIGPKQTKCLITDKLIDYDVDNKIVVEQWTSTPDVPSGSSFQVRTRLFFSWASDNSTKMYVLTSVEWSGKSWIKSAIEKGSIDGQKESMKTLIDSLKDLVSEGGKPSTKSKKKPKRKKSQKEKKVEAVVVEKEAIDDTIMGQISHLLESIGKLVSFDYVSDYIKGVVVTFFFFLTVFSIYSKIISSRKSSSNVEGYNSDGFLVVASIDKFLENKKIASDSEANLWEWIENRSEQNPKFNPRNRNGGSNGSTKNMKEIKEMIMLTQSRLNEINEHLPA